MLHRTILAALALMLIVAPTARAQSVSDEQVTAAIDAMRRYLYARQDPASGSWDKTYNHNHAYPGGVTSLVVYALLASGESPQRPQLDQALRHLRGLEPQGTYQAAFRAHVWAQLPDAYRPLLDADAQWLRQATNADASFSYTPKSAGYDNSNTQYGVLGLWEAAKRGIHVDDEFWRKSVDFWLKQQMPNGGWAYRTDKDNQGRERKPTGSMTAAGLTALYIAQQELLRSSPRPDARIAQAIAAGQAWMNGNFKGASNPNGGWQYYYLVGVERVALAGGDKDFNGQDWFCTGAAALVKAAGTEGKVGSGVVDTAFALLFLSRGRVPVWITKLAVPGANWNNRPNDLYFLTKHLSDYREGELNWQVLSIDQGPAALLSTPLVYLAGDGPVELNDAQRRTLREYLDLGGLLWANPDGNSSAFVNSVRSLVESLYPDRRMQPLPDTHPLFGLHVPATSGQQVWGLHNGVRDLVIMPSRDWGLAFQSETDATGPHWKMVANLFVLATDRGVLANRLVERVEPRASRAATGMLTLGRARYDGAWLVEPAAWKPLATHLFNRSGINLLVSGDGHADFLSAAGFAVQPPAQLATVLELDQLAACNYPLVHLSGVQSITLSDSQLSAIKTYLARGGTLLIETVGGGGAFAQDLEVQLRPILDTAAVPLADRPDEPIITGRGLTGGYDNRSVTYRRFSVLNMVGGTRRPRLVGFYLDNRPAVILSQEDLSLGLLGVRHWGIHGYSPQSATRLMTNIALAASQAKLTR